MKLPDVLYVYAIMDGDTVMSLRCYDNIGDAVSYGSYKPLEIATYQKIKTAVYRRSAEEVK